jgi:hypothetical protein
MHRTLGPVQLDLCVFGRGMHLEDNVLIYVTAFLIECFKVRSSNVEPPFSIDSESLIFDRFFLV